MTFRHKKYRQNVFFCFYTDFLKKFKPCKGIQQDLGLVQPQIVHFCNSAVLVPEFTVLGSNRAYELIQKVEYMPVFFAF